MSDREKLLKQWRNLPANERVTWETFKRQSRPKIIRQSRPDDWKASRKSSVTHPRTWKPATFSGRSEIDNRPLDASGELV